MELRITNIEITTAGAVITVEPFSAQDYRFYKMDIGQYLPANVGTETVTITDGTTTYSTIDNAGNIVQVGKLRGLRGEGCKKKVSRYRLQFGENGMPEGIPHFVFKKGLCSLKYNGTPALDDED